ncbi:hypothetical protein C0J26_03195 [Pseudomonas baetica]|nr:hypothetical protein C0J26_03195 [Pseudomonas baetica]
MGVKRNRLEALFSKCLFACHRVVAQSNTHAMLRIGFILKNLKAKFEWCIQSTQQIELIEHRLTPRLPVIALVVRARKGDGIIFF